MDKGEVSMISSDKVSCNDLRDFLFKYSLYNNIEVVDLGRKYRRKYSCGLYFKSYCSKLIVEDKINNKYKDDINYHEAKF